MTGKDLTNATYQISSGSAKWAQKYTREQREMIARLLTLGHSMQSIRNLEKAYPGELHLKVCVGLMATRDGQGSMRVLKRYTDSEGHEVIEYDQNQQVAQMCSIAAKPPKRTPPLPDSSSSKPKKRPRLMEPLEEDSFLLRVDNSDDELHSQVIERLRGKGYTVTKNGDSSSS